MDKGAVNRLTVGIAQIKTARDTDVLVTLGLGSCVVVAIYDDEAQVGALAHIMLPEKACGRRREGENMFKYADEAIPAAVRSIEAQGGSRPAMKAKIAGGSCMFDLGRDGRPDIGRRNVEAARDILGELKIPLVAEDTGGRRGRSVEFLPASGEMLIRTIHGGERRI